MNKLTHLLAASASILSLLATPAFADHKNNRDADDRDNTFSFALIGDTPYGVAPGAVSESFDRMQAEINNDRSLKWVMHAGDIKSGSSNCSDALFFDRLDRFNDFKKPFVLTPGDNDWTDCHRVKAGEYQPLERLARLREVFFNEPGKTLGGRSMRVDSQAFQPGFEEFPENMMWKKRGVVFATLHVIGSANGLAPFDPNSSATRSSADDQEVERRIQATVAWLNRAFDKAESENAPGVFLMIQANPALEISYLLNRDENGVVARNGFNEFLQTLQARTAAYGKPVVLAHGDSHWFRVDKPELPAAINGRDTFLRNFTRVESFGSSKVHWVKVNVNPETDEVFQFEQKLVEGN